MESKSFSDFGSTIGISASQCHAAFKRLVSVNLVDSRKRVTIRKNLLEFLVHGLKYVFPAQQMGQGTGILTAHAAPVWHQHLVSTHEVNFVWASENGHHSGIIVEPLYKTVPMVATQDEKVHAVFALIDSIRLGKARERDEAASLLEKFIYD